ncbi:MAG: hypothetical protein JSV51_02690 [Candidatus Bathyarchaeota archaeon]|nr:MAG: hypothetical protein JSV51_02690 [Candidatus Bathyarchaeota archaeon]
MHQKKTSKLVTVIVICGILILLLSKTCSAQNFERKYFLIKGQHNYQLTLSITHSLYEYYQQKNHLLTRNNFASFVTPYTLEPVAEDIKSIFPDEEDFVNAILMLVHQIPYQISEGAKYPAETIVENEGDCDLLSYVAASLMLSQNMSVVLFYYEQESHVNVGVGLDNPPRNVRTAISYIDFEGVSFYMAECTGNDWRDGWRVGECPSELEGAQVSIITLENCEQIAPGQIQSSFETLESSEISLTTSTNFITEGSTILLSGQVSATNPEGIVALYAAANGNWFSVATVELVENGRYGFSWTPTFWGQYHIKASWSGDAEHAGADSRIVSIYVIPKILIYGGGAILIVALMVVVLFLASRTTNTIETLSDNSYNETYMQD